MAKRGNRRKPLPLRQRLADGWQSWRPRLIVAAAVLLLGVSGWGVTSIDRWVELPGFDRVVISGQLQRVQPGHLRELIQPALAPGFFATDLDAIRELLESQPWIYRASVIRAWPGELHIRLVEEVPIARWGKDGLLNHRGTLFARDAGPAHEGLPRLFGPDSTETEVMDVFRRFNRKLASAGLAVSALTLDSLGHWTARLGESELVLGDGDPVAQLQRFLAVYERHLKTEMSRIARVDMRYRHGLAVAWRELTDVAVGNNSSSGADTNG